MAPAVVVPVAVKTRVSRSQRQRVILSSRRVRTPLTASGMAPCASGRASPRSVTTVDTTSAGAQTIRLM